jgi:hypothetical protein
MTGPFREEFIQAMGTEISELKRHDTWAVVPRSLVPEGANVLPSTWAFKIKRFPDGMLRKFTGRFCA